jgi:hypothetical protein
MRAAIASILSFCSTEGPASLFLPIQARLLVRPLYRPFQSSSRVDGAGTSWRFEDPLSHTTKMPIRRRERTRRPDTAPASRSTPPAHSGGGNVWERIHHATGSGMGWIMQSWQQPRCRTLLGQSQRAHAGSLVRPAIDRPTIPPLPPAVRRAPCATRSRQMRFGRSSRGRVSPSLARPLNMRCHSGA